MVQNSLSLSPSPRDETTTSMPSQLVQFWQAFSRGNASLAQEALQTIHSERLSFTFSFDDAALAASSQGAGAFKTPVLPDTPSSMLDLWNSNDEVHLQLLDAADCCRARIGVGNHIDCLACGLPLTGDQACSYSTHRGKNIEKMSFLGKAWVIPVKRSTANAKLRLFASIKLERSSLPAEILSLERDRMLETMSAKPRVWRLVLEEYLGSDTIEMWANTPETGGINPQVRSSIVEDPSASDDLSNTFEGLELDLNTRHQTPLFPFQSAPTDIHSVGDLSTSSEIPGFRNLQTAQIQRLKQTLRLVQVENRNRDTALAQEFAKLRAEMEQSKQEMEERLEEAALALEESVAFGPPPTRSEPLRWNVLASTDKQALVEGVIEELTQRGFDWVTQQQLSSQLSGVRSKMEA